MAYIFKGTILGGLCRDCIEPLAGLKLKFYRLAPDRNVTALAVAAPKDTFSLLDDAAVEARRSLLLGEAEIDERGNFSFEFAKSYDGGPFEVDLHCGTVPRLKPGPRPPQPLQFTITTLQPSWRPDGAGFGGGLGIHRALPLLVPHPRPVRRLDDLRPRPPLRDQGADRRRQGARLRRRLAAAGCAGRGRDRRQRPFPHRLLGRRLPEDDLLAVDQHRTDRRSRPLFPDRDAQRHGAAGRAAVARAVGRPGECRSLLLRRPLPGEAASDPGVPAGVRCARRLSLRLRHPQHRSRIGADQRRQPRLLLDGAAERASAQDAERPADGVPVRVPADRRVGQSGRAVDCDLAGPVRQHRARQAGALCAGLPGRSRTRSRRPGSTPTRRFPAAARSMP